MDKIETLKLIINNYERIISQYKDFISEHDRKIIELLI